MMNDVRIAVVAFVAVVIGFGGAWFIFGAHASKLADENDELRRQTTLLVQQLGDVRIESPEEKLIGRWATTVEKSRLGKIELIFELRSDGTVTWESQNEQERNEIANGQWRYRDGDVHFAVTITDETSPQRDEQKTTIAMIKELTGNCLTLSVDGSDWSFHRAST